MRQIVLDTETTGLEPREGHRIIEIGCVEMFERRLTGNHFHVYINPKREIDAGAFKVHGISNEFLADKPVFNDIIDEFLDFIGNCELIIHNAVFDIGFLNHELNLAKRGPRPLEKQCPVLDTLLMARQKHPRQKNNLDALCRRYDIDNTKRDLHGALLDAEILALVYLAMTGGQSDMFMLNEDKTLIPGGAKGDGMLHKQQRLLREKPLFICKADVNEQQAHQDFMAMVHEKSGLDNLWLDFDETS